MHQDGPGSRIVQSIRWWDFAGTPVKGDLVPGIERPADFKARDPATTDPPDWTVGVRLDRTADGRTIIADVKFARDTPGAIHALMARTAQEDGPLVAIGWWQDPGQAGVDQDERLKANMAEYGYAESISASKNKREYARDPSRAAFQGQLHYVVAPWNARFFNQLQDFPNPKEKDDAVDALSGAWHWLVLNPGGAYGYEAADHGSAIVMPGDADFFLPPSTRDTPHHRYQESTGNRFGRGRRVL
jgi:predicted phage terminase large subunit-like protein